MSSVPEIEWIQPSHTTGPLDEYMAEDLSETHDLGELRDDIEERRQYSFPQIWMNDFRIREGTEYELRIQTDAGGDGRVPIERPAGETIRGVEIDTIQRRLVYSIEGENRLPASPVINDVSVDEFIGRSFPSLVRYDIHLIMDGTVVSSDSATVPSGYRRYLRHVERDDEIQVSGYVSEFEKPASMSYALKVREEPITRDSTDTVLRRELEGPGEFTLRYTRDDLSAPKVKPDEVFGRVNIDIATNTGEIRLLARDEATWIVDDSVPVETPTPTADSIQPSELQRAGVQVDVPMGEGESDCLILLEIPVLDQDELAVTTPDYELVSPEIAWDALLYQVGREYISSDGFNWSYERDVSIEQRPRYRAGELWSKAGSIASASLETYAMARTGLTDALPVAMGALRDSIGWAHDEFESPYEEAMSGMSHWTLHWEDVEDAFGESTTTSTLPEDVLEFGIAGLELYNTVETIDEFDELLSAQSNIASRTDAFTTRKRRNSPSGRRRLFNVVSGEVISHTLGSITDGFRLNAEFAAIGNAYHTVRIPLLGEITELEHRINNRDSRTCPVDVFRYFQFVSHHHSMATFAMYGMFKYQERLNEKWHWRQIQSVSEDPDPLQSAGESWQISHAGSMYAFGDVIDTVNDRMRSSVNHQQFGPPDNGGVLFE
ncbi:hypothetical protein [Halorubrum sp. DTA98]|uniref:hypothetical protein n=1 Tax=Halorubrum sp. DTA98 TaxID=3402163 RepID=UPI003AAD0915